MARRRLLVATYYFPPDPSVGSRRWQAMASWLSALGHEVTVLTTRAWGSLPGEGGEVVRTPDLVASGLLRRMLRRPALPVSGAPMPLQKPPTRLLADVIVPDAYLLTWGLAAAAAARRLISERGIECLITSGPPHSTHLLGLMLGKHRPAWIADFRDGWRFETLRAPWPLRWQDRLDAALERRVMTLADRVVGVTEPIVDDAVTRLGARAAYVPNGWDPRAEPEIVRTDRPALDRAFVNVVHTGQLSGLRGRDPRPLFEALDVLRRRDPGSAERLRIVLAGRLDRDEQQLLDRLRSAVAVVHVGHLNPLASAALQRDADALLLLTSRGHRSQVTGKVFEYLTAGRPIIALAEDNEAARLVVETGTGITVPPDNPEAIADALLAAVDGRLPGAYAPRGVERYVYPGPANEFAVEVERALALHPGSAPTAAGVPRR